MPEVREAEDALTKYHDGRHVLSLSAGHASLQMALAGLEIATGDEVITTPYSYGAPACSANLKDAAPNRDFQTT